MKTWRKITSAAMSLLLLLSLTACGRQAECAKRIGRIRRGDTPRRDDFSIGEQRTVRDGTRCRRDGSGRTRKNNIGKYCQHYNRQFHHKTDVRRSGW